MSVTILGGDCRDVLATLPADSVQACVTSPPYYGLRDYQTGTWSGGDAACDHTGTRRGHGDEKQSTSAGTSRDPVSRECRKCGATRTDSQIGLESSPDAYVSEMVAVFRAVRRVLRPDGVLFLNLGDSYCSTDKWGGGVGGNTGKHTLADDGSVPSWNVRQRKAPMSGIKPKDLLMIPARVALALQADGWWLRSDIIWAKVAPMPESVRDRPTRSHEHVFLLTKNARYFYNTQEARDPLTATSMARLGQPGYDQQEGSERANGGAKTNGKMKAVAAQFGGRLKSQINDQTRLASGNDWNQDPASGANWRDVWPIASGGFGEAHFAVMPPELAERCIKAGSKPGDTILDPFAGAFTTPLAADRLQRHAIGIELNADYCAMARKRLVKDAGMFMEIADVPRPEPPATGDLFDFSERDPRCEPRPDWTPPEWLRLPGVDP